MGGSYGHLLILGATQTQVRDALGNEPSFLATFGETTAVFSRAAVIDAGSSAVELSALVEAAVVGFTVFDDDILACTLCRNGELIAQVTEPSLEEYMGISTDEMELMAESLGEAPPNPGTINDPHGFVMGVGTGNLALAREVLSTDYRSGERVLATDRHIDLLNALELPAALAGWDFFAFEQGIAGFTGPTPTRVGDPG